MTVSESRGIAASTFLRLCSRAPRTWMKPAMGPPEGKQREGKQREGKQREGKQREGKQREGTWKEQCSCVVRFSMANRIAWEGFQECSVGCPCVPSASRWPREGRTCMVGQSPSDAPLGRVSWDWVPGAG